MPTFEVEQDGQKYQVDADNEQHAWEGVQQAIAASQQHPANGGFGTRDQREPAMIDTGRGGGADTPTIPYATAMADQIHNANAGDAATEGAFNTVPFLQRGGSYVDSLLSNIGINGPGVNGPISQPDRLAQLRGAQDANEAMHPTAQTVGKGVGIATQALLAPSILPETLGTVGSAAATGAVYGGLQGADTDGSLADKAAGAGQGAMYGGVGGMLLGGAAKGLSGLAGSPAATAVGNEAVQAGDRLGINVPKIVATDSTTARRLGQGVNSQWFGTPVGAAVQKTADDLGGAVQGQAGKLGSVGDANVAGTNLRGALTDFTNGASRKAVADEEKTLAGMVDDKALVSDMPTTATTLNDIAAKRGNAGIGGQSSAAREVMELATRPEGANISGLRTLRTRIGEQLNGLHPNLPADFDHGEARAIYGALTKDLEGAYAAEGGTAAVKQFGRANAMNRLMSMDRSLFAKKLLGQGQSPEGAFKTLTAAAQSGGRENANLLMRVKSSIPQDKFGDFSASLVNHLGRDADGNFSPERFLSEYGKMTDTGKATLFDARTKAALDDVATVSRKWKDVSKLANRSNTALGVGGMGTGIGIVTAPLATIATALGGHITARILAAPATSRGMSNFSNAYGKFVQNATTRNAQLLHAQTKSFALLVAREIGDVKQAPTIEQALLAAPVTQHPPNQTHSEADLPMRNAVPVDGSTASLPSNVQAALNAPVPNPNGGFDINDGKMIWTVPTKNSPKSAWTNARPVGTPAPVPYQRPAPRVPGALEKTMKLIGGVMAADPESDH